MSTGNVMNTSSEVRATRPVSTRTWIVLPVILLISGFLLSAGYIFFITQEFTWPFLGLAIGYALVAVLNLPAIQQARAGKVPLRQIALVGGLFAITSLAQTAFMKGAGLQTALIFLVFSLIMNSILSNTRSGPLTILLGLVLAAGMALLGAYSPYALISVQILNLALWALLALILVVYVFMQIGQFIYLTLQVRLTTAFIAIVVVSIAAGTIVQNQITLRELQANTSSNVLIAANQVADYLDKFMDTTVKAVQQEALLDPLYRYLLSREQGLPGETELTEIKTTFRLLQVRETNERVFLSSYALLDKNGVNVYDTTESNIGLSEGNQAYFLKPFETGQTYVSDITFTNAGYSYIYFSAPVRDLKRQTIGVLRVRYNGLVFQRILETYSGLLGITSHAVLFDENMMRLADTYTPDLVYSTITSLTPEQNARLNAEGRLPTRPDMQKSADQPGLERALLASDRNPSFRENIDPVDPAQTRPLVEIGGISTMKQKPWKVVYLQANFDDTPIREGQVRIATLIATLIRALVGSIAVGLPNVLPAPVKTRPGTAEKIASGDLSASAKASGNDEFGTLGRAFNQMTAQLRSFINELEDRVSQRTQEIAQKNENLTYRSRQLQTVAEVARGIVTSQDLLPLLDSVTHLISERFNFYHVGIFLIDPAREFAVLRAANSEGGKRMLARQHRLGVGKTGIVGYVTGTGRARIATDVGEDSVFFNNPDLPMTRSEMALPLRIGDEIIGALDVQSTQSNAFTSDDIDLFSTLADQVAIAIHNNNLFTETAAALTEAQNIHRQYLRQEWSRDLASRQTRAVQYSPQGIVPIETGVTDLEGIYQAGEPVLTTEQLPDQSVRSVMTVPIILRGEPIGVIRVQDSADRQTWSEDEKNSVREVAQQVSVALEAARLLEQTVHRAEREKKVLEITGRIRASNDPQEMLEIAASELQKALGASRAQIFIRKGTKPLSGPPNGENGHSTTDGQPGNPREN